MVMVRKLEVFLLLRKILILSALIAFVLLKLVLINFIFFIEAVNVSLVIVRLLKHGVAAFLSL
jgi:hypothetical protein